MRFRVKAKKLGLSKRGYFKMIHDKEQEELRKSFKHGDFVVRRYEQQPRRTYVMLEVTAEDIRKNGLFVEFPGLYAFGGFYDGDRKDFRSYGKIEHVLAKYAYGWEKVSEPEDEAL